MKKTVSRLLAILMLIALLFTAANAETVRLAYESGALNIRSGPSKDYNSVGTVHDGDHITVLSWGSVWSKIRTDSGKTGYIKNLYIKGGSSNYASGTTYFDGSYTAYITATVNFRAGASTSTKSMGTLKKGAKVTVLGKNGSFYLVANSAGTQGFVHGSYLSKKKDGGSGSSAKTMTVKVSCVNVRADGGMSAKVIGKLYKGNVVTILKKGNYWYQIRCNGLTGWVKKEYLK